MRETPAPPTPVLYLTLPQRVFALVAREYGIAETVLAGPGRDPLCVQARRVFYAVMVAEVPCTYSEMGRVAGRDHSTVLHHLDAAQRDHSYEFREMLRDLTPQVHALAACYADEMARLYTSVKHAGGRISRMGAAAPQGAAERVSALVS